MQNKIYNTYMYDAYKLRVIMFHTFLHIAYLSLIYDGYVNSIDKMR